MENLFDKAMAGIGEKVALQEIRKVLRGKAKDKDKLEAVVSIIHTYEDYSHRTAMDAENREMEAEEAEMRQERFRDAMDGMLENLTLRQTKGGQNDK